MTDKKLTDEEVVKALECCKDCCCKQCDEELNFQEAIDLINRQKEEIDSAKAEIEICAEVIKRQDAEIKRLKECPKCVYEYDGEVTEYCIQGPCPNLKPVRVPKTFSRRNGIMKV